MELDFFFAVHKHKMLVLNLKAHILDIEKIDINDYKENCEIDNWIKNYAEKELKNISEVFELKEIDKDLHSKFMNIIELKDDKKIQDAVKELKKTDIMIKKMNKLFRNINTKINN